VGIVFPCLVCLSITYNYYITQKTRFVKSIGELARVVGLSLCSYS
jgi:hypothetical protein